MAWCAAEAAEAEWKFLLSGGGRLGPHYCTAPGASPAESAECRWDEGAGIEASHCELSSS